MINLNDREVWFVTGSQHLYGPKTLQQVDADSTAIAKALDQSSSVPVRVIFKPVVTTPDAISQICVSANIAKNCIGVITWMHTFSPAKMWIAGLNLLQKPVLHLHTQFNRDIPWSEIDMDFMNLNQSAHGDREYGFIMSRLRRQRKVVVGHWQDGAVQQAVGNWSRAAAAWADWQGAKFARFGDNMREVAVTEGDKVEAQIRLGYSVNGFGVGDLVKLVREVPDREIETLLAEYSDAYSVAAAIKPGTAKYDAIREQARIEAALRNFMESGGFKGFTTTFEDLHGLTQLPGLASQRLMAAGYGFGAEGDWKHAALVRALKVMSAGMKGGTSFMEDYTYHLDPKGMSVLGAHMLEICPSIAEGRPSLEVHQLGIGGKEDPARLVFNVAAGPAVNATLIDMGNRFRMIVNVVDVITPANDLPRLPVARALWIPRPDLPTAAAAWIYGGGAHHTAFSQAADADMLETFAEMAGLEYLQIDKNTSVSEFKKELLWNEVSYLLNKALA